MLKILLLLVALAPPVVTTTVPLDQILNDLISRVTALEARVTALEANGPQPIYPGWDNIVSAINSAAPGDTITLPNGPVTATSFVFVGKSLTIKGDPGGKSKLIYPHDVTHPSGSNMGFYVGYPADDKPIDVRFTGFEIMHDRKASTMRTQCFVVGHKVNSFEVDHMVFTGITANVVGTYDDPSQPVSTFNLSFHDNTINEWWESIFILNQGHYKGVKIYNNNGKVTNGNPNTSVSRPYGVALDPEFTWGSSTDVEIYNNNFDATGIPWDQNSNSLGIILSQSDITNAVEFHNINIHNNALAGFFYDISVRDINGQYPNISTPSLIYIQNNTLSGPAVNCIRIWPDTGGGSPWGNPGDTITLTGNDCKSASEVAPYIDLTNTPALTVINSGNTYHQ